MSKKQEIDWRNEPMPSETDLKAIMMDEENKRTRFRRWNAVLNWAAWNGVTNEGSFNAISWVSWAAKRQGFNRYGGQTLSPNSKVDRLQELVDGCIERGGRKITDLTPEERKAIEDKKAAALADNPYKTTWISRLQKAIPQANVKRWGNGDMSDQKYLQKMVDTLLDGRDLSAKQEALCEKIMNRKAEAEKREKNADVGWGDVMALLNCAKPFYKKTPTLKVNITGTKFVLYIAGHRSKYSGQIMVKEWQSRRYNAYGDVIWEETDRQDRFYGRINTDGSFVKARAADLVWADLETLRDNTLETVAAFGHRMGRMGKITQSMMDDWKKSNGLGTVSRENMIRAKKKQEGSMGNLTGVSAEPTLAELMAGFGNDSTEEE